MDKLFNCFYLHFITSYNILLMGSPNNLTFFKNQNSGLKSIRFSIEIVRNLTLMSSFPRNPLKSYFISCRKKYKFYKVLCSIDPIYFYQYFCLREAITEEKQLICGHCPFGGGGPPPWLYRDQRCTFFSSFIHSWKCI